MLGRTYESQTCSVARTLELVGERWTLLIIRDAFLGVRRFGDFAERLGIARNVLQDRLERLVEAGVLTKVPYQERPLRHEYRLTDMGRDLWPSIVALLQFGDKHLAPAAGPPMLLLHRDCGGERAVQHGALGGQPRQRVVIRRPLGAQGHQERPRGRIRDRRAGPDDLQRDAPLARPRAEQPGGRVLVVFEDEGGGGHAAED